MSWKPATAAAPGARRDRRWVAEVVLQIQRGERLEEGYERLFREYEPALRGLLLRRGCCKEDVDDVVQEGLLRVYQGIGSFRFDSTFDTWIMRVVINVWLNHQRRQPPYPAVTLDHPERESPGAVLPQLVAPGNSAFEETLAAERRRRLGAALDELPPRMRQCVLFRLQGHKDAEIAQLQNVAPRTVKKQWQKGLARLRRLGLPIELLGLAIVVSLRLG